MKLIYAVIVEKFEDERCSVVTLHKTKEGAENAILRYKKNCKENGYHFDYYIREIDLDVKEDIIFDSVSEEEEHFNE